MNFSIKCCGMQRRLLLGWGVLFVLVACGGSDEGTSVAPTFNSAVVVGASLSDTGNACAADAVACPPAPPYAMGQYSNGALWVEAVAAHYGASAVAAANGGVNFAYAGARTGSIYAALQAAGLTAAAQSSLTVAAPSVPGINAPLDATLSQIDQMLTRFNYRLGPQTLAIVDAAAFGNNIADALMLSLMHPADAAAISTAIVTAGVGDIVAVVQRLYAAGARTIVVLNAPNIGATPRVQALGASAIAAATQLSNAYNTALAQQMTLLRNAASGLNLVMFDLYALEALVKAGSAPAGFTVGNSTDACVVTTPAPVVCATPDTYFYWDAFHPTAAVGAYLATQVVAALPPAFP